MGRWRFVERTAAVALTGLIAVLAPSQVALSDERGKPELVTLGMSRAEVEALMGSSSRTCWNYDRGAHSHERICFLDGMVHSHGETRQEAGRVYFKTVIAPDWPPSTPAISSTEVRFGMDPRAVTRLRGKPDSIEESYTAGTSSFHAAFVDGELVEFERIEPIPLPGSPPPNRMVFFDTGSTMLTPQAEQALEGVVQDYEQARGSATVVITACTDGSEAESHSPDLSQRRGDGVKDRLVALGVPGDRIEVVARGASAPLLITPPGATEPLNRRVEIWVRRT